MRNQLQPWTACWALSIYGNGNVTLTEWKLSYSSECIDEFPPNFLHTMTIHDSQVLGLPYYVLVQPDIQTFVYFILQLPGYLLVWQVYTLVCHG